MTISAQIERRLAAADSPERVAQVERDIACVRCLYHRIQQPCRCIPLDGSEPGDVEAEAREFVRMNSPDSQF